MNIPKDGPDAAASTWRKCTTCKKLVGFASKYWVCSVSTCNRQRTGLLFCSVACFDAHIPVMNHRDAGAIEHRSPSLAEWQRERAPVSEPKPQFVPGPVPPPPQSPIPPMGATLKKVESVSDADQEILVIVSKLKGYIRDRSGMNTSDSVMDFLSERVRTWSRDAIRRATQEGRKTVLDRDFKK